MQYLPFRLAGVVQCYIKANPPLQYVTWTKDKRLLEPYQTKDIVIMNNGSLLFTRVNQNHQGRYTCTPYNAQGTQGSSGTDTRKCILNYIFINEKVFYVISITPFCIQVLWKY